MQVLDHSFLFLLIMKSAGASVKEFELHTLWYRTDKAEDHDAMRFILEHLRCKPFLGFC